jgi:hypothetical protein
MENPPVADELKELARTLGGGSAPATSVTITVLGSRSRGDHRPDSDLEVSIQLSEYSDSDRQWRAAINDGLFATIDAKLPGPLCQLASALSRRVPSLSWRIKPVHRPEPRLFAEEICDRTDASTPKPDRASSGRPT